MSSSDRVDKFLEDSQGIISDLNLQKILAEVKRLRSWLQKHQDERITDGAKTKLFSTIQSYFKAGQGVENEDLKENTQGLVEDLLKLPEGKLVTAKCKKSALRWLSATSEEEEHRDSGCDQGDGAATERRMLLVDVDGETASVMNISGGDVVDGVPLDDSCRQEAARLFAEGGDVHVLVQGGIIISITPHC